ncbi:MAG: hypothetical protein ACFFD2_26550 [Promethearchaeota archaeon]
MKGINDLLFECLKPKLEHICDKIQNSLDNVTDETKQHQSGIIESYAKIIHEMLKYIESKEPISVKPLNKPKLRPLKNYIKILH